jgi:hypothetical protein
MSNLWVMAVVMVTKGGEWKDGWAELTNINEIEMLFLRTFDSQLFHLRLQGSAFETKYFS